MERLQRSAGQIGAFLALAGDAQPEIRGSRLDAFQHVVLLTVVVELLVRRILSPGSVLDRGAAAASAPVLLSDVLLTLGFSLCLLLGFFPRSSKAAGISAAVLAAFAAVWYLPETANHAFLMALCLFFLAAVDRKKPEEQALALQALRWCWVIVFFASGIQKLIYGLYFRAELLIYMIAHEETFATLFGALMPAGELVRIRGLAATGGPYLTDWTPLVVMSNVVWIFEILAPVLLLFKPTRSIAAVLTLCFVAAIELGARELFFGVMAVNLTLLFFRRDWIRRLLPAYVLAFSLLILVEAGILWPGFEFF